MRPHLTEGAQARLENRPVWLAIIFILAVLAAGAGFLLHLAQQSRRNPLHVHKNVQDRNIPRERLDPPP